MAPLTESPFAPMEHKLALLSGAIETIVAIGAIGGIDAISAVVMKFGTIFAIDVMGTIGAIVAIASAIGTNGIWITIIAIFAIGIIETIGAIGAIVVNESPSSQLSSIVPLDQLALLDHWIAK